MATKAIRAKKNPVSNEMVKEAAVAYAPTREKLEFGVAKVKVLSLKEAAQKQGLPADIYKEILQENRRDGRFLFVDKKSFEYFQTEHSIEGLSDATKRYGEEFVMVDLFFPDGIVRFGFNISEWRFV